MKINKILLVSMVIFLTECQPKKQLFYVAFHNGFNRNNTTLKINDQILFQKKITTNYSVNKAGGTSFYANFGDKLVIIIDGVGSDTLDLREKNLGVGVSIEDSSIVSYTLERRPRF